MFSRLKTNQSGVAHLAILTVIILVVIGAAGYFVYTKQKDKSATDTSQNSNDTSAVCETDDKDLCKFFSSWKENKEYRVTSKTTTNGMTTASTFEYEADGQKSYIKTEGDPTYEVITIGDTTYTKSGDTWWKQTTKPETDTPSTTDDFSYDFEEPAEEATEKQTTYKKIGKESCGDLQCFKYQVIDPNSPDTIEYIFFDDKDYQLRKLTTSSEGTTSEQTFEYENVNIQEPSPVKELGENQYIIPGQSEPVTLP